MSVLPLAGIRVLDLGCGVAAAYAAKLLVDLGADIVKVEPPEGDLTRAFGPFAGGVPDSERSGMFMYLNTGKRGVVLDLTTEADRVACLRLAESFDLVLTSSAPGQATVEVDALRAAKPALVVVSVTPFGQFGPRAGWTGNDLIAFHSSGFAFGFPALQVDNASLPPLNAPTYAAELLSGQVAAAAAMHGLLALQATGRGSHLDVSLQEAVAAANNSQFNRVQNTDGRTRRIFSDKPSNSVVALLPCADGWVAISPREEHQWTRWLDVMGRPEWSDDLRFSDRSLRDKNWAELYPLLAEWTRQRTKSAVSEAAQAQRVACMPLGTATDLLSWGQLAARDFFVVLDDAGLKMPGRPYSLTVPAADGAIAQGTAGRSVRAPRLGEHTADVLYQATALRRAARTGQQRATVDSLRPLKGVRIVDFSWVLTGPICTKYLAALGAEVIKVESAARADLSQRNLAWEELNPGKRSITLNLKESRARELVRDLIARSEVVVENFSTGVMDRLGLDYASLQQINPRIIMASSSALGRTGPDRDQVAYGTLIQCLTGWAALSAHPGYPPRSAGGVWTDPLTAGLETFLVLAAIWRQRETGVGCLIDLSMAETTIAGLPEPILAWCLTGAELQARGNRHPLYAPQGCYPARGDDRWVALSVQSDAQWRCLCEVIERRDLADDARFSTQDGRRQHHDLLDNEIAAWTRQRDGHAIAEQLQARGIAATATLEPADIAEDTQLRARSFIAQVERLDGTGTFSAAGTPWLVDEQRPMPLGRPPRLGQDNEYVFKSVLGLDDVEYDALMLKQVIY